MSYRFAVDPAENLVFIKFTGEITYHEEVDALLSVLSDPRMQANPRILVDKTQATMLAAPENVQPHIELISRYQDRLGVPQVAHAVSRTFDFGMTRMLELNAEGALDHVFQVFHSVEAACAWLDIDPAELPALQD